MRNQKKGAKGGRQNKKDDVLDNAEDALGLKDSPIYDEGLNLHEVLTHPSASKVLNPTYIEQIEALISSDQAVQTFADFKEDGRVDRHDTQWLFEAVQASEERAAGVFEAFLQEKLREDWGEGGELLSDDEDSQVTDTDDNLDEPSGNGNTIEGLKNKARPTTQNPWPQPTSPDPTTLTLSQSSQYTDRDRKSPSLHQEAPQTETSLEPTDHSVQLQHSDLLQQDRIEPEVA